MVSLFLFRGELFADIFDDGEKEDDGATKLTKKSPIRFPKNKGIAGHVAETGEVNE
jgi:hypothetical protein